MEWIITCKISGSEGYRIFDAFKKYQEIDWHKSNASKNIQTNDIVYIYVGAPHSRIMFKTICTNDSIMDSNLIQDDSEFYNDLTKWGNSTGEYFRIKLLNILDTPSLSKDKLNELGLVKTNIQGSFKSKNNKKLFKYIDDIFKETISDNPNKKDEDNKFNKNDHYYFWQSFFKYVSNNELFNSNFKLGNTLDRSWLNLSWYAPLHLVLKHGSKNRVIWIYISDNIPLFEYLVENIAIIKNETKLDVEPNYDVQNKDLKHRRIDVFYNYTEYDDKEYMKWLVESSLALKQCLDNIINSFYHNNKVINQKCDDDLIYEIRDMELNDCVHFEYNDILKPKTIPSISNGIKTYPRNKQVAMNALNHANYECEIDTEHKTFIRRNGNIPYTEPHHLIPMAYQDNFEYSIDIEENIVSLCSNCHNEIHYGKNAHQLIEKLYYERKEHLKRKGIDISLDQLLSFYK